MDKLSIESVIATNNEPLRIGKIIASLYEQNQLVDTDMTLVRRYYYILNHQDFCDIMNNYITEGGNIKDVISVARVFYVQSNYSKMSNLIPLEYNQQNIIIGKRKTILDNALVNSETPNPTTLYLSWIYSIYNDYNNLFFSSKLPNVTIEFSNRLITTAGRYHNTDDKHTIEIGSQVILQTFTNSDKPLKNAGITVKSKIEALCVTLEHEIVHMIISANKIKDNCMHGSKFVEIARGLFGHTEYRHNLLAESDKSKFKVGQRVSFEYNGTKMLGNIKKCNPKKAVVEMDNTSISYQVPYKALTNVK